jgi:hypothetical protein
MTAGSVGNPAARHSLCVLNRAGPCSLKVLGGVIYSTFYNENT